VAVDPAAGVLGVPGVPSGVPAGVPAGVPWSSTVRGVPEFQEFLEFRH